MVERFNDSQLSSDFYIGDGPGSLGLTSSFNIPWLPATLSSSISIIHSVSAPVSSSITIRGAGSGTVVSSFFTGDATGDTGDDGPSAKFSVSSPSGGTYTVKRIDHNTILKEHVGTYRPVQDTDVTVLEDDAAGYENFTVSIQCVTKNATYTIQGEIGGVWGDMPNQADQAITAEADAVLAVFEATIAKIRVRARNTSAGEQASVRATIAMTTD